MSFTALLKQSETEVKGRADNLTGTSEKQEEWKERLTLPWIFYFQEVCRTIISQLTRIMFLPRSCETLSANARGH